MKAPAGLFLMAQILAMLDASQKRKLIMLHNKDKIRLNEIGNFLKESWCIDGSVKFNGFDKLAKTNVDVITFELTDSVRGKFLVSISKLS